MTVPARRTAPRKSPLRTPPIIEVEEEEEAPIGPPPRAGMLNASPAMEMRRSPIIRTRRFRPFKIIAWGLGLIIGLPIVIAIVIGTVQGIAGATSGTSQAVVVHDPYRDCLALASTDGFAPEVCTPLNPTTKIAKDATDAKSVADFNNGFSDSKLDDCEQGFAKACDWLKGQG